MKGLTVKQKRRFDVYDPISFVSGESLNVSEFGNRRT